jgi:acyl-CoA thioester hydrolase
VVTTFSWPVRVYYEDTDVGGVVYYANYLRFFERARTEWLRAIGFEQRQLKAESGIVFAVRSVQIDYLRPAVLDDALQVEAAVSELGRASMHFRQRLLRDDEVLSTALVKVVSLDGETFRPVAIPAPIRERIDAQQ